jgi:hypothetical protein
MKTIKKYLKKATSHKYRFQFYPECNEVCGFFYSRFLPKGFHSSKTQLCLKGTHRRDKIGYNLTTPTEKKTLRTLTVQDLE